MGHSLPPTISGSGADALVNPSIATSSSSESNDNYKVDW